VELLGREFFLLKILPIIIINKVNIITIVVTSVLINEIFKVAGMLKKSNIVINPRGANRINEGLDIFRTIEKYNHLNM
jgi:hypothetical protein